MRVLIVSAVYPPEPVISAQTSAQVAQSLASSGCEVTVVTSFPNRPGGTVFPGFSRRLVHRQLLSPDIQIVRCFSTLSPESRISSRLLENLSFGLISAWQVLTVRRPDVIYANTWPIVATGILFLVASVRHISLVVSVQDIYPEALVVQNRIAPQSILARLLRWIDGVIARHSAHVIVISERFAEIYRGQRRVPAERLSLIPNWIDSNQIDIGVTGEKYRQGLGLDAHNFLLVYGGNVGVAAGVETLVEAMHLLTDEQSARLLIAGAGSQLARCQQLAAAMPDQRVFFHTPWAAEDTSAVLRAADLLILPTRSEQSLVSAPSKLLTYMLSGRPILATATPGSDLAETVHHAQCGWVVEPDRPDLLADKVKEIMQLDPAERQRRGDNGRVYVLQHYAKEICVPHIIHILENVEAQNR